MRAKTFLIGLSTGIVGGLTAVLLTTPQSGKQLRENIVHNSQRAKTNFDDLKHHVNNVFDSVSALKNEVKNNIPNIMNEVSNSFSNFQQETQLEKAKIKEELDSIQKVLVEFENKLTKSNNKESE